jgi:hypothetical protein
LGHALAVLDLRSDGAPLQAPLIDHPRHLIASVARLRLVAIERPSALGTFDSHAFHRAHGSN